LDACAALRESPSLRPEKPAREGWRGIYESKGKLARIAGPSPPSGNFRGGPPQIAGSPLPSPPMRSHRIRSDLRRERVGAFQLPLGLLSEGLPEPRQGFVTTFREGEEDQPDTYLFEATISQERLQALVRDALDLLPGEVRGIVEVESLDAYRTLDVYLGTEAISRDELLADYREFEGVLLEDTAIGFGANADEPYIEVFLDGWKTLAIEVPGELKSRVEALLSEHGLDEVEHTWPPDPQEQIYGAVQVRPVLEVRDDHDPNIDEVLLQLRDRWALELDVDPYRNLDEEGTDLGLTLWHAIVMVLPHDPSAGDGAYMNVWATAGSLAEMEAMIDEVLAGQEEWMLDGIYSIERVAFDERPDELASLPLRRSRPGVHLVELDSWSDDPPPEDRDRP
jgi:hypothetical protein